MRVFLLLSTLLLSGSAINATDNLPVERQLEIIINYMRANGMDISTSALAAFDYIASDDDYRQQKCGTPAAMEFVQYYDRLDKELLKQLGLLLRTRPNLDDYRDSEAGLFRIHYDKSGSNEVYQSSVDDDSNSHPDYVDKVADVMDSVYAYIIDTLGYLPPPQDGYEQGGDEKYDVYLWNLGQSFYGLTMADSVIVDQGANSITATTFMKLSNDYTTLGNYEDRPLEALRVTAAHEFFHAVQFGLDYTETESDLETGNIRPYWVELSAVWMENEIYDDINDYYYYLPYFFENPAVSIQSFGSSVDLHPYGSAIFAMYLSERFGRDIIHDIWLRCRDLGPGPSFLTAADNAIDSISGGGENWTSVLSEFALACYFIGEAHHYLPVELRKTRYWSCNSGSYPDCTDSSLVIDTADGYDWVSIDTTLFYGFSEGDVYPEWHWLVYDYNESGWVAQDARHKHYQADYPAFITGNTNTHSPQHNGMYFMELYDLAAVPPVVTFWNCDAGVWPNCTDSTRVRDTTLGYDFTYTDSAVATWIFVGDGNLPGSRVPTLPQGWGLSMIFQIEPDIINPTLDSVYVENELIADDYLWFRKVYDWDEFRSFRFVLSPSSTDLVYFSNLSYRLMELGYLIGDTTAFDPERTNLPSAVLNPYPNPVVVASMNDPHVTFEFQVETSDSAQPMYGDPHLVVDIFNLAGERVVTLEGITSSAQSYLGIHRADWDLRNEHHAEVASGVYIAYARLFSKERKGTVLAEDHKKVAIIR